jgi:superfamily II DNA or RNA helicase
VVELRAYQGPAVEEVLSLLPANPILVAPTGSGKTVMGCEIVRRLAVRTLWLAHRTELITQAMTAMFRIGVIPGAIKAGMPTNPGARIQVASVQTAVRRDLPGDIGLIVIDECHHATADQYQAVLEQFPGVPVVGLTATPFRLDGRGLGDAGFGEIVVAATTRELVDAGTLHAPRVFAGRTPDLRGVRKTGGDYNVGALAERTNTVPLVDNIVEHWRTLAPGLKTVAFAVDVEHSCAIANAFIRAGVPWGHIDGTTPTETRAAILQKLRRHEIHGLSNCMVLTEGWDLPALECAILARPTASLNLHLQMIGRIMRSSEGKDGCIVLDHAGNHHVHGLVTRPLEYSLAGKVTGESDPLGLRRCGACYLLYDPREPACPECGWVPEKRSMLEKGGEADDLYEFVEDYAYRAELWNMFLAQAEAAGYKPTWAGFRYKERFGQWPILDAHNELIDTDNATREQKSHVYRGLLATARRKGFKEGWASYRYKDMFGVWPKGFVTETRGTGSPFAAALARRMG